MKTNLKISSNSNAAVLATVPSFQNQEALTLIRTVTLSARLISALTLVCTRSKNAFLGIGAALKNACIRVGEQWAKAAEADKEAQRARLERYLRYGYFIDHRL